MSTDLRLGEIHIARASVSDAEEILSLQKLAYQSEAQLYGDWSLPPLIQALPELIEQIRTEMVLKAVRGGSIVGSVRALQKDGTGFIGTRLMLAMETMLPEAERFELFTGDRSLGNIELYRRLGYESFRTQTLSATITLVYMQKNRRCA